MSSYEESADGMRAQSYGAAAASDDDFALGFIKGMAPATVLSNSHFEQTKVKIYRLFSRSTDATAKSNIDTALAIFFAVHGTSPDTQWSSYDHDIEVSGVSVPPVKVVEVVGADKLKQFFGRYTQLVVRLYMKHDEFKNLLRERIAKAQLSESDGYLVIDYVGKDGSLDPATMRKRALVKAHLVAGKNERTREQNRDTSSGFQMATEIAQPSSGSADPFNY